MLKQRKICSACLQENEPQALVCSNCGTAFQFNSQTPVVAVELQNDAALQKIERSLNNLPPPNTIALHVVSSPEPILVAYRANQRIILGRDLPQDDDSAISLSGYHAQEMGVSRQHAVILITDDGCTVEDLNSTNGTWLNEVRLIPQQPHLLRNGDLLRLGHLMIFVSFQE